MDDFAVAAQGVVAIAFSRVSRLLASGQRLGGRCRLAAGFATGAVEGDGKTLRRSNAMSEQSSPPHRMVQKAIIRISVSACRALSSRGFSSAAKQPAKRSMRSPKPNPMVRIDSPPHRKPRCRLEVNGISLACHLTFLTEIPGAEFRQNSAFVQDAITLTAAGGNQEWLS
jgi:hypothetical protein